MSSVRAVMVILILACLALAPGRPVLAAEPAATGEVSAADLERLVATLENDAKRGEFLATLKAALAARDAVEPEPESLGARALGSLSGTLRSAGTEVSRLAGLLTQVPAMARRGMTVLDTPQERAALGAAAWNIALVLLAGVVAHGAARRFLRRPLQAVEQRIPDASMTVRGVLTLARLVLVLVPPALIAGAAWGMLAVVQPARAVATGATVVVGAFACYQVVMALARTTLSPARSSLRFLPLGDAAAHTLMVWIRRLTLYTVSGYFALEAAILLGLPTASHKVLLKVLALGLALMLIAFVLHHRAAVAAWLRQGVDPAEGESRRPAGKVLRDRLAYVWHILAAAWVAVAFVVWAADLPGGFLFMLQATALSAVAVAAGLGGSVLIDRLIERAAEAAAGREGSYPGLERRVRRYARPAAVALRAVVWFTGAVVAVQAWGGPAFAWLGSAPGQRVLGSVLVIGSVVVVALVVWEVVNVAIERALSPAPGTGPTVVLSARARTLIPLARNVLMITLLVLVTLVVLSEIGVNIVPLLAGAGVIGLAVGFGSQKLVQDVITGAFILFENTIAIGDVVRVGSYSGVVEGLTIRTLRLRDTQGNVHVLPFSAVASVTNMSREFAYSLTDIGIAYREDTDHVSEVLGAVGEELRADPTIGPMILEPLEIMGLERFDASAVILRVRFKTLPLKQWAVSRAFNRLIKKRFDELGIEMPFPHTTVYFGEDKAGKAPPARLRIESARHAGLPEGEAMADGA